MVHTDFFVDTVWNLCEIGYVCLYWLLYFVNIIWAFKSKTIWITFEKRQIKHFPPLRVQNIHMRKSDLALVTSK